MSLFAMFMTAAFVFARSIDFIKRLRNKSQAVTAAESLGISIPLQRRNASFENSVERPLVAENHDMGVEKDAELAPKYGVILQND